jgi:hypothetical protein
MCVFVIRPVPCSRKSVYFRLVKCLALVATTKANLLLLHHLLLSAKLGISPAN